MRSIENFTSSAVKSEPSWNFTPLRSLNSQVVVVDRLPALRQARLDLQLVAGPHQRVEHVLQRLGVRAGRGEVRIDRFRTGAGADGQRLRDGGEAEASRGSSSTGLRPLWTASTRVASLMSPGWILVAGRRSASTPAFGLATVDRSLTTDARPVKFHMELLTSEVPAP